MYMSMCAQLVPDMQLKRKCTDETKTRGYWPKTSWRRSNNLILVRTKIPKYVINSSICRLIGYNCILIVSFPVFTCVCGEYVV